MLALLFCTARRRNGFAAVQDLVTKTRVISRAALESRPVLSAGETPPPAVDAKSTVGPYHVLETLETGAGGQWLLGYDLRLLRKVWIRTVPPGTPPVSAAVAEHRPGGPAALARRAGARRRRTGMPLKASAAKPLLRLIADRQPWSQVRFWLYDLAREIGAAEKDGTLPPVLTLDRVWITGDGRAKLLDFSAPGLAPTVCQPAQAAHTCRPCRKREELSDFLPKWPLPHWKADRRPCGNRCGTGRSPAAARPQLPQEFAAVSRCRFRRARDQAVVAARHFGLAVAAGCRGGRVAQPCHCSRLSSWSTEWPVFARGVRTTRASSRSWNCCKIGSRTVGC